MRVLVTGSSGYLGSRLIPALLKEGHEVVACSRDGENAAPEWLLPQLQTVEFDATNEQLVHSAVQGVDAVYYLIHGMGGEDFADVDRRAAQIMADAVTAAGVPRVVYVSGIVPPVGTSELSEHIASRVEVEQILGTSSATVITLRAAVILGAGSTSYEVIRQITEKMPIQTIPNWMHSQVQPIAVTDMVTAMVCALTATGPTRHIDVGGEETMQYSELLQRYADAAGLDRRTQITVPLLPTGLVGAIAGRLIDVPTSVVEALVESLHHDMVCADLTSMRELLPAGQRLVSVQDALAASVALPDPSTPDSQRGVMQLWSSDPEWAVPARYDTADA